MSDQENSGVEPHEEEQLSLLTMDERVAREVNLVWGRHSLVTTEGGKDVLAIAELIYPTISNAIVEAPADRTKVGITPTQLMAQFFADVPGPAEWTDYDEEDAEFRERVYAAVKAEVFRVLSVQPNGPIQSRLGANGGLVLCRMPKKRGREELAYVTRNRKCIDEDNNAPAMTAAHNAMNRAAALTALSVDRVPEHGKWFERQHKTGIKLAVEGGQATIRRALEAASNDLDDDVDEAGDE
jgi:hypothetical protein